MTTAWDDLAAENSWLRQELERIQTEASESARVLQVRIVALVTVAGAARAYAACATTTNRDALRGALAQWDRA